MKKLLLITISFVFNQLNSDISITQIINNTNKDIIVKSNKGSLVVNKKTTKKDININIPLAPTYVEFRFGEVYCSKNVDPGAFFSVRQNGKLLDMSACCGIKCINICNKIINRPFGLSLVSNNDINNKDSFVIEINELSKIYFYKRTRADRYHLVKNCIEIKIIKLNKN